LFEVTVDPAKDPKLSLLLRQMSGFDSVDDESKPEMKLQLGYLNCDIILTGLE
jgi:AMP deaminase